MAGSLTLQTISTLLRVIEPLPCCRGGKELAKYARSSHLRACIHECTSGRQFFLVPGKVVGQPLVVLGNGASGLIINDDHALGVGDEMGYLSKRLDLDLEVPRYVAGGLAPSAESQEKRICNLCSGWK